MYRVTNSESNNNLILQYNINHVECAKIKTPPKNFWEAFKNLAISAVLFGLEADARETLVELGKLAAAIE